MGKPEVVGVIGHENTINIYEDKLDVNPRMLSDAGRDTAQENGGIWIWSEKLRLRDKTSGYPTLQRSHLWEKSYVLSTKQKALIGFHSTLLTNPEEMWQTKNSNGPKSSI